QLGAVDEELFYHAVNCVRPSLIRIDSDEVTYNLHIIVRFELEQELIDNRVAVSELPEAWNARMHEYLGVDVPDDARGVLQDMHWAGGSFGYFPTYALGNVISVQIWERALEDLGDLDERFERGEFGELRDWLREHLYRLGSKFTPQETVERVTVSRLKHERLVADDVAALLEEVGRPADEDDAALVRITRRDAERARQVPAELAAELAHASGVGVAAWDQAKETSDFAGFMPYLE